MSTARQRAERLDELNETFFIVIEGVIKFRCEREHLLDGHSRGCWEVFHADEDGNAVGSRIDRDQYSNDIVERAVIGKYDRIGSTEVGKSTDT